MSITEAIEYMKIDRADFRLAGNGAAPPFAGVGGDPGVAQGVPRTSDFGEVRALKAGG